MTNGDTPNIRHLVLIAGRKQKDRLLSALAENGGHFFNIHYGSGSIKAGLLMDMLGLIHEENKVVITCLMSAGKVDRIFEMLVRDFQFDKPNTGIAYTIPLEKLCY